MKGEAYVGRKFSTEFLGSEFQLDDLVSEEFIRVSRLLDSAHMGPEHAGNISVRTGDGMFIKAGGVSFKDLTSEGIVLVADYDRKKNLALAYGVLEPSSETPMHWLIYKNYPKALAVIHAHDPLVLEKQHLAGKLGVAVTKKEESYGTLSQADEVVAALRGADYVFIKNHGSVCVGKDLYSALKLLMDVHRRFADEGSD